MSAPTLRRAPAPVPDPRRVVLRAERDAIERRQYADAVRLAEIRAKLATLAQEGRCDA